MQPDLKMMIDDIHCHRQMSMNRIRTLPRLNVSITKDRERDKEFRDNENTGR